MLDGHIYRVCKYVCVYLCKLYHRWESSRSSVESAPSQLKRAKTNGRTDKWAQFTENEINMVTCLLNLWKIFNLIHISVNVI